MNYRKRTMGSNFSPSLGDPEGSRYNAHLVQSWVHRTQRYIFENASLATMSDNAEITVHTHLGKFQARRNCQRVDQDSRTSLEDNSHFHHTAEVSAKDMTALA
jgi:hypothetical protein